ncbi:MAG: Flp pilus assembly complex ATPase component TadA, partial [Flavobacteriaceae bacterium]|nr:Flp pilus assembly complex ATPase component TadA [Flavobacteriaceae bacterium]
MKKGFNIPVELKQLISSNVAFHYRIVPMEKKDETIIFMTDENDLVKLTKKLGILLNSEVELRKETTENLQSYLSYNYRRTTSETKSLSENHFLEELLQTAKDFNSSDIHLEPYDDACRVRFRLDGKLKEQYQIPTKDYPWIINQIKVRANLDIAQKRISQDGRITVKTETDNFDIRVSTMPTLHGEKIVLRILKQDAEAVELSELGFNPTELEMYLEGIKMPNGIVLISGPTGSGKTTTLYGTLKLLNKEETNIVTIEDPI